MPKMSVSVPLLHFGTDGVRGVANSELTPELALRLGQVAGEQLRRLSPGKPLLIGKDTRRSCTMLEDALSAGACSVGVDVLRLGIIPTPAVAYLVEAYGACGGAVISASHNPATYNGIKFFDSKGFKLGDDVEAAIEAGMTDSQKERPVGAQVGVCKYAADAADRYIDHLRKATPLRLKGRRIAIDCANGATAPVAPRVFRLLGADVEVLFNSPDGMNINLDCGSTHPQKLIDKVKGGGFDIGFAFDGDGDRLIAVDEKGEEVDGDVILAILADYLHSCGKLPKNGVVTTVMTNLGFDLAMRDRGIKVTKTKVGDRFVLEEMSRTGMVLGGEQSGHIIYLRDATTGDGLVSALQLLRVMVDTGKPLSELASIMHRLPQCLINVPVRSRPAKNGELLTVVPALGSAVASAEGELGDTGRVLVRPSGTEPLVRVMVEAGTEETATTIADRLAQVVTAELGS